MAKKITKVAYTAVVADLFHYGHLSLLKTAKVQSDYHICGVLTDEAANSFRPRPISNFEERKAIISSLDCVDEVVAQHSKDPTENLKKVHERFQEAEVILVHGDNWKYMPGREYVESIGGSVFQPPYYERLSDRRIMEAIQGARVQSQSFELFTEHFRVGNIIYYEDQKDMRKFLSTKANTLKALQPLLKKSRIEKTLVFNVGDWYEAKTRIVSAIKKEFSPGTIVIRSSAVNEDSLNSSMAGYFMSVLDIPATEEDTVVEAIEKVVKSYGEKKTWLLDNQVLVQTQTDGVEVSGVVFTRDMAKNAPYYVINYDDTTGKTDTVTSGRESKKIDVFHDCTVSELPPQWHKLMEAIKEIEEIIPNIPLDIEFAINNKGEIIIFQVRPLLATHIIREESDLGVESEIARRIGELEKKFVEFSRPVDHLGGKGNGFSDMAFWNPAEIIGDSPNYLAYSLYCYIITDAAWHIALSPLGYVDVNPAKLMVLFGNKPYIDLRASFNALTPASVPFSLRDKLVEFYLQKLMRNPHLHDKIEFEIVYNCYDFMFDKRATELLGNGITTEEIDALKGALLEMTNNIIISSPRTIGEAVDAAGAMAKKRGKLKGGLSEEMKPHKAIEKAIALLDECRTYGTIPFSQLARMAFMGKAILRGLLSNGIIEEDRFEEFFASITTVASEFERDFNQYMKGKLSQDVFLEQYGHLRPGTYEITVPRYVDDKTLIEVEDIPEGPSRSQSIGDFQIRDTEEREISEFLKEHGLRCTVKELFSFIRSSIEGREYLKFEFTKNLSEAIEFIAMAGRLFGFERKEMSQLDMGSLQVLLHQSDKNETIYVWRNLIDSRIKEMKINEKLSLPPLFFSEKDFRIVKTYTAQPNYITNNRVEGEIALLEEFQDKKNLAGKIAVIEKADPGYDWIFTKNIAGLITKYGGTASHMTIRCAEFELPAAIGCGEDLFNRLKNAKYVVLDCSLGKIELR